MRKPRAFAVAGATALLGVAVVAAVGSAQTPSARPAARRKQILRSSAPASRGKDRRTASAISTSRSRACAKGQKPLQLALFPIASAGTGPTGPQGPPGPDGPLGPAGPAGPSTAGEYAVANVFVSRGTAAPASGRPTRRRWAHRSVPRREDSSASRAHLADKPCMVSIAAAVLSNTTGSAHVYARVLIYKQISGWA